MANFQEDGIDLAVRFGGGTWPGLEAFKLLDEEFFPVCSPEIFEEHRPTEPAGRLYMPMLKDSFIPWELWFHKVGAAAPKNIRGTAFTDANLLLRAAADSRGAALARSNLVGEDIEAGRLVRLFSQGVRVLLSIQK